MTFLLTKESVSAVVAGIVKTRALVSMILGYRGGVREDRGRQKADDLL